MERGSLKYSTASPNPPAMNPLDRIPSLDGLRGIAALCVMIFHFNYFFLPQAAMTSISPVVRGLVDHAYLGVDLFFIMSGFVMAHVYGRQLASNWRTQWWEFATTRFSRIYPLLALTVLAMVITRAFSNLPLSWISFSIKSLILQLLLLQEQDSGLGWNYASWSLSVEAAAYLFFVFAARPILAGKHPRVIAAICIATLVFLSIKHQGRLHVFVGRHALWRGLSEFALGALIFRSSQSTNAPRALPAVGALCCFALAVWTGWDLPTIAVLSFLVYYGVNAKSVLARILGTSPALALGAWSYSIYLWHAPTHYAMMAALSAAGHSTQNLGMSEARLLILGTSVFVVCLAAFTFRYFEIPAKRLIRRQLLPYGRPMRTPISDHIS